MLYLHNSVFHKKYLSESIKTDCFLIDIDVFLTPRHHPYIIRERDKNFIGLKVHMTSYLLLLTYMTNEM